MSQWNRESKKRGKAVKIMKRFLRENGLSIALFTMFAFTLIGMSLAGWKTYNGDQKDHQQAEVSYVSYLTTGAFVESVFENWESEFLQMSTYVLLTVFLFQKGAHDSKKLDQKEDVDEDPRQTPPDRKGVPWPVRRGGLILLLYENSLVLALFGLFVASFFLHAAGGARDYCQNQAQHGSSECPGTLGYMATARFWFESFQNWQSEFLSIGVLLVFSIYLRQRGSPESKPVAAPHSQTGEA